MPETMQAKHPPSVLGIKELQPQMVLSALDQQKKPQLSQKKDSHLRELSTIQTLDIRKRKELQ
jgi:hypothetical protein